MNKKILAVVLIVLTISLAVVSAFAITPPQPTGSTTDLYQSAGNVQESDAEAITRMLGEMKTLGMFQFGDFILVGRRGSTTRLFISKIGYTLSNDGTTFTLTPLADQPLLEYSFVDGGFALNVVLTTSVTFTLSNVLCWWAEDTFHINPDYSYGSAHSDSVINTSAGWHSYYLAVYDYDQNINDARQEGESIGYQDGYVDGHTAGYNSGYSEGQTAGYNSGYAAGQEFGEEIGYDEGYQEGYEGGVYAGQAQGYETGFDDGYETGYYAGYDVGHQIGSFEGFETGLNEGFNQGYDIGFEEGYDTGFVDGQAAGGGSDPTYTINCAFLLAGDTDIFYFYWDGSDPSSMRTDPLNEQPEGYVLYTVSETFTSDQWRAPSSINLSVPALIQERYGFHFARYYDRDLNFLYFQVYVSDYNIGFQDGADILDGIGSIAAAPVNGLASVLDFDVFGVNVKAVIIGILSILVALLAWRIIKKFVPV